MSEPYTGKGVPPPFEHEGKWESLLERFLARGAKLRAGDFNNSMIEHLLDCVDDLENRVRNLEAKRGE